MDSEKMPVGFGLALAMDTNALRNFAILPDSQKAQVIAKARNAHGRSEMQSIVHALAENKTV